MTILVATTCAAWKASGEDAEAETFSWLAHADDWREQLDVTFFAAVQVGQGREDRLDPLVTRVISLGGSVWRFSIDDGEDAVNSDNRLIGITTGRNLAHEWANRHLDVSHILFLDTDTTPPVDAIEKLLELDHPIVGFNVPQYVLSGPDVPGPWEPGAVREHWNTAGALMITREVAMALRWRWQVAGPRMTDDPAFQADAVARGFGPTWTRHDIQGSHRSLVPVEVRGHDLSITRA